MLDLTPLLLDPVAPQKENKAGLNVGGLDVNNPREVMETAAHEGRHGRTAGSSNNEEAASTIFGREVGYQWSRRNHIERSHTGGYDGNTSAEWRDNAEVASLINQGNAQIARIDPADMDFRQLHLREVKLIENRAAGYAKKYDLDIDQARTELTQQALWMVDKKWAEKEYITDNPRARAELEAISSEEEPLSIFAMGEKGWRDSKEIALFTADEEDYNNPYLFSRELSYIELRLPVNPRTGEEVKSANVLPDNLRFYISKYGTESGAMPIDEVGGSETWGAVKNKAATTIDQLGMAVEEEGAWGLTKRVAGGMWESLVGLGKDIGDRGVKPLIPELFYNGSPGDKMLVDRLQGDRESQVSHSADSAILGAEIVFGTLSMGGGTVIAQGGKQVVKEGMEQATDIARRDGGDIVAARGEGVVPNKVDDVARDVTRDQSWFDDVALSATRNPDSNRLVLGHFAREGTSYQKVAAHYEASYFKVDDWNSVTKGLSNDEIWRINETFLDQQVMQGKQILFSHNPLEARPSSFFEREVNYLQDLGYKFNQKNQWTWEAVYEPK